MDRLGLSLAHLESKCANFYDAAEVERVFYPEIEKLLLEFFPDATDALVYNQRARRGSGPAIISKPRCGTSTRT
jgi:hypothetical protein